MSKIILDAELRARLNGLNEQVEFCDPGGGTVGRFLPEAEYRRLLHLEAERSCPFSEDELERLRAEKGMATLDGFWQGLEQQ